MEQMTLRVPDLKHLQKAPGPPPAPLQLLSRQASLQPGTGSQDSQRRPPHQQLLQPVSSLRSQKQNAGRLLSRTQLLQQQQQQQQLPAPQ